MRVGGKKYNKFISIFALILAVVFLFALLFGCSNVDEPPEYENPPEQSGPSEDDPPETDDPPEEDPPETDNPPVDNPPVDNPPAEELPDDVYAVCDGVTAEYMGLPFESGEAYVHANRTSLTGTGHDYQPLTIYWKESVAPYTVEFAEAEDFSDAESFVTSETHLTPGVLIPERGYNVRITDGAGEVVGTKQFVTESGVRWITVRRSRGGSGASNVRDLGGMAAGDGRLSYGKIFRGSKLIPSSSQTAGGYEYSCGILSERLGIKTEIDLCGARDDGGQTSSPIDGCAYVKAPITGYTSIFSSDVYADSVYYDKSTPESIAKIFALLADESNYPVYFHCRVGKDRTGTLAYLIGAVLGVSYEDLTRDFELSSLTKAGRAERSMSFTYYDHGNHRQGSEDNAWEKMHSAMMSAYSGGGSLRTAAENYLETFCHVPREQIQSFRSIMISGAE